MSEEDIDKLYVNKASKRGELSEVPSTPVVRNVNKTKEVLKTND